MRMLLRPIEMCSVLGEAIIVWSREMRRVMRAGTKRL